MRTNSFNVHIIICSDLVLDALALLGSMLESQSVINVFEILLQIASIVPKRQRHHIRTIFVGIEFVGKRTYQGLFINDVIIYSIQGWSEPAENDVVIYEQPL